MNDTSPLVSVGMPVYNGERYVEQAMCSILNQTYTHLELIVCDNASTDRTADICQALAREDARVRYVRNNTNIGAAGNFNKCLELATGPYFRWACADDWSAPQVVAGCVEVMEKRPEVVLCYAPATIVDENGTFIRVHDEGLHLKDPDVRQRFLAAMSHGGLLNVLQGMMRTAILRRIARMGAFYSSDVAMVVELSLWGPFVELEEAGLYRRMHSAAASAVVTQGERWEHLDPNTRRRVSMLRWRHHWEHTKAVWRTPQEIRVKLRLYELVLRTCYWDRRRLIRELAQAGSDLSWTLGGDRLKNRRL